MSIQYPLLRDKTRILVGATVFLLGLLCLLLAAKRDANDLVTIVLGNVGGLLSGSVAIAGVYEMFLRDKQQRDAIRAASEVLTPKLVIATRRLSPELAALPLGTPAHQGLRYQFGQDRTLS